MLTTSATAETFTASDLEGLVVGCYMQGTRMMGNSPTTFSTGKSYFERNGADNKVVLKNFLGVSSWGAKFTISGDKLIMDLNSDNEQVLDNSTSMFPVSSGWTSQYYNGSGYVPAYGYSPTEANGSTYPSYTGTITRGGGGLISIEFNTGLHSLFVWTNNSSPNNAEIYDTMILSCYPSNAIATMTNQSTGSTLNLNIRVGNTGNNFAFYNLMQDGWRIDKAVGVQAGYFSGTLDPEAKTLTIPAQEYFRQVLCTNHYWKAASLGGSPQAWWWIAATNLKTNTKTLIGNGANQAVVGTYTDVVGHKVGTDLWAEDCGGDLLTVHAYQFNIPYMAQKYVKYASSTASSPTTTTTGFNNNTITWGKDVTLTLTDDFREFGLKNSDTGEDWGLYVGGTFTLGGFTDYFDHAEIHVVPASLTSIDGQTLSTTEGLEGAFDITPYRTLFHLTLPSTWDSMTGIERGQWMQDNIMANKNGVITYNQYVPKAELQTLVGGILPNTYSVFAKVFYNNGMVPTFHGLKTLSTPTTGVNDLTVNEGRTIVGRYDLQGRITTADAPGMQIIRYSDGTAQKVIVK